MSGPAMVLADDETEALLAALGAAQPAYFTAPTPGARHDLAAARVTAHALGTPLMPWQELVTRVASERRPGHPEQFRYKVIVLTVPRQSGKTTIMRTLLTQRAMTRRARRAFYTAQTGKDATERWKDLVSAVEAGPLGTYVKKRLAAGSQALTFPNGSTISPFAPTPKSLHGYTPHDVMVDEIFAFDAGQGNDLMGAIGPAQVTLPDRQLWLVSTMGHSGSTFLNDWIEQGRTATADPASGIAYFEWSLPEGLDPYDPASWGFHPALGHTITADDLAELSRTHTHGEWMRAFMNRRTVTIDAVIDAEHFATLASTTQTPPRSTAELSLAYEVALDRSRSAILAAWTDPTTGQAAVRVVVSKPGADWVAAEVARLRDTWKPKAIGADDGGPTRAVTDQLRRENTWAADGLTIIGPRDFVTAWDQTKAAIRGSTISQDGAEPLAESVANAVERTMGQGWALDRMKSRGPIPELIAATIALRLHENAATPAPQPMIWTN